MCALPFSFFFFNDTATTEIYTLSLHDALPILRGRDRSAGDVAGARADVEQSPTRIPHPATVRESFRASRITSRRSKQRDEFPHHRPRPSEERVQARDVAELSSDQDGIGPWIVQQLGVDH